MSRAPEVERGALAVQAGSEERRRARRLRLVLLAAFFVASLVTVHATGLTKRIDLETIRELTSSAGVWGLFVFWAVFALGVLVHLPGLGFVGAASVAYGTAIGMAVGYVGAFGAAMTTFVLVRSAGGQPLADVRRPWMRKVLARLESHPVSTVALLRLFFFLASWVNYGCAMSAVRMRDYALGSAIGLIPQAIAGALFFEWAAERFL